MLSATAVREDDDFPGYEADVIMKIGDLAGKYRMKMLFIVREGNDFCIFAGLRAKMNIRALPRYLLLL